jgi:hypothetical protein
MIERWMDTLFVGKIRDYYFRLRKGGITENAF